MYIKKTSLLRLAVCMAFIMTLLASMAAPALANNQMNSQNALVGTEQNPADAAITKCLQTGQETTAPTVQFNYKIDRVSYDGDTSAAALGNMPAIPDKSIAFSAADRHPLANNMSRRENLTDFLYRESSTLFPSSGANAITWPRTGIYVYRVTEVQQPQPLSGYNIDASRETFTLSKAQYDLYVYVGERTQFQPGTLYVWAIGAYRVLNDEGNNTGGGVNTKVNPQPGGPGGATPYSQMIFNNKYLRHGSGQSSETKFKVSNNVTGLGSSTTLYFNYDVTINKPAISTKTTYRVYIFEGTSTTPLNAQQLQANVLNAALINPAGYIDLPIGSSVQIMLKSGQYMSFADIEGGATYIVNERPPTNYTASYTLTKGGLAAGSATASGAGVPLSTPTTPPVTITISPAGVTTWVDTAAFSNLVTTPTPTGIAADNMPYVAFIVIALAALGGYLFFRSRGRKNAVTSA